MRTKFLWFIKTIAQFKKILTYTTKPFTYNTFTAALIIIKRLIFFKYDFML